MLGETLTIRTAADDENELFFDVPTLQNGIYFIIIRNKDDAPRTHKLIVI